MLGAAVRGTRVEVVVEIDSGHHRSGVTPDLAGEVAEAAEQAGLEVVGVFTFPGHSYGPGAQPGHSLPRTRRTRWKRQPPRCGAAAWSRW